MKKMRLRMWVKVVLGMVVIVLLVALMHKLHQEDLNNYNKCIKNNSESYCARNILGNY